MRNSGFSSEASITILLLLCTLVLSACPSVYNGPFKLEERTLAFDMQKNIFNPVDTADPAEAGLGIEAIVITVTTENASGDEELKELKIVETDLTAVPYSRVGLVITGKLISVSAVAGDFTAGIDATNCSRSIDSDYTGWTAFANLEKFKLNYFPNRSDPAASSFTLLVCPRAGSSPTVRIDAGVQTGTGTTDRAAALTSGQIAFTVEWAENPEDLTYDVYYAVVSENLSVVYNEDITYDATYNHYPWTDSWTYDEVVTTGRNVGGTVRKLSKYNSGDAWKAVDPLGDSRESGLIDLTNIQDPDLTKKFLLLGIVLHSGGLSAPLDMLCTAVR